MPAEPNATAIARLFYFLLLVSAAFGGWGVWGASQGCTQGAWLMVLGLICYLPLHAVLGKKETKAA
jgi:dipeptide/tripeptide permease